MGEADRLARIWLAIITVFLVFQTPLMNHKLAMACNSALEALKNSRQTRADIEGLREQLRNDASDRVRDPIVLQTALDQFPLRGPR